ncbi:unnamed protein product [Closterium sp. NIES-65]|nr:unnamed protein product [Closterium sp. NIES-65]
MSHYIIITPSLLSSAVLAIVPLIRPFIWQSALLPVSFHPPFLLPSLSPSFPPTLPCFLPLSLVSSHLALFPPSLPPPSRPPFPHCQLCRPSMLPYLSLIRCTCATNQQPSLITFSVSCTPSLHSPGIPEARGNRNSYINLVLHAGTALAVCLHFFHSPLFSPLLYSRLLSSPLLSSPLLSSPLFSTPLLSSPPLSSPLLFSPPLSSPLLSSPLLSSPLLSSPPLSSPPLPSPRLSSPHLAALQVLPSQLLPFLDAPVPFVVGLQAPMVCVRERASSLVIVNLAKNKVCLPCDLPLLPEQQDLAACLLPHHAVMAGDADAATRLVFRTTPEQARAAEHFQSSLLAYFHSFCASIRSYTVTAIGITGEREPAVAFPAPIATASLPTCRASLPLHSQPTLNPLTTPVYPL